MTKEAPIFVAGHRGMVGAAIVRVLQRHGMGNIVTRTHAELDLTDQAAVRDFFAAETPGQVYLAAARVGGIHANNTYPAEFIYQNVMIEANVIHEAWRAGVQKLLFLGSSCIYPRMAPQQMAEKALLTGTLEATNEPYAIAKIAGIKLCESYNRQYGKDFRSVIPSNLYGPAIIIIRKTATLFRRSSVASMRPGKMMPSVSLFGAPACRGGSFFTSMTWPRPVFM